MFSIKRSELIEVIRNFRISRNSTSDVLSIKNEEKEKLCEYLVHKFEYAGVFADKKIINRVLNSSFYNNIAKLSASLPRNSKKFSELSVRKSDWMDGEIKFDYSNQDNGKAENVANKGRPEKTYKESSVRSQQRKRKNIFDSLPEEDRNTFIFQSASKIFREDNNHAAAQILDKLKDPKVAVEALDFLKNPRKYIQRRASLDETLAMIAGAGLTKDDYNIVRDTARKCGHNLFPDYKELSYAKSKCYPKNLKITEEKCETPLKDLLEHVVERIFEAEKISPEPDAELLMISKYGMDATNIKDFKQTSNVEKSHTHLLCVSMVPLKIINKHHTNKVYYENNHPNSVNSNFPISIEYACESKDKCREIENSMTTQLKILNESSKINGHKISHEMHLSMVDGKVTNYLCEDAGSLRCFICHKTISSFNKIDEMINTPVDESSLKYGFPVFHAYLRFMSHVIHVSYELERDALGQFKVYQGPDLEENKKKRKSEIQLLLRQRLGIIVDQPLQGHGNTNDGNTARTFFKNIDVVAEVTGFDYKLLDMLSTILVLLHSGESIDPEAFKELGLRAARRNAKLYNFKWMPTALHIILIHGFEVIKKCPLPIAAMSEEALESNHKYVKNYRLNYTRKFSRKSVNEDLMNRLFINSDPVINSMRKKMIKKHEPLDEKLKSLII